MSMFYTPMERLLVHVRLCEMLYEALAELTQQERDIIMVRYNLRGCNRYITLATIDRISIEEQAMDKIRTHFALRGVTEL